MDHLLLLPADSDLPRHDLVDRVELRLLLDLLDLHAIPVQSVQLLV